MRLLGSRHAGLRRLCALGFLLLLFLGSHGIWWFRGSTAATSAFDRVPFVDPLAAIEATLAARQPALDMWLGAALLIAAAALLGAVFCGWLCPLGLVFDLNDSLRRRVARALRRRRVKFVEWSLPGGSRYLVLGAVLGFAVVTGWPLFQALSPIHLLVRAAVFAMGTGLVVIAVLLVVEWFAPRLWCRSLCPAGALYALLGRWARFSIRVDPELAGQYPCRMCTLHCPMGIAVMEDYALAGAGAVDHLDCTRCGSCIDACPRGTLRLGFGGRNPRRTCHNQHCL